MAKRAALIFTLALVSVVFAIFGFSALEEDNELAEQPSPPLRYHRNYSAENLLSPVRHIGAENAFGTLAVLAIVNEWLVVFDVMPLDSDQLLVIDRDSGEVVHSTGRAGQGPTDIAATAVIATIPGVAPRFFVNDYPNGRLMLYDLANWTGEPERIVHQRDAPMLYELAWLPGDILVANGPNFTRELLRFYRVDPENNTTELVNTAGGLWFPTYPESVAAQLSYNEMSASPRGDKLVLASRWTNRLEIYDRSGELVHTLGGPEEVVPRFRIENRIRVVQDHEAGYRPAYVDVDTTSDHVYALFSGQTKPNNGLGQELHVFTWQGELVAVFGLSEGIYTLAIAEETDHLYGISVDPYPAIIEYRIPAIEGSNPF